jgi:hypothetical protein
MIGILRNALLAAAVAGASVVSATSFAADVSPARPSDRTSDRSSDRTRGSITAGPSTRQSDRERYAALTEQNIFVKDRRSLRSRPDRTPGERPPMTEMEKLKATPEAKFVLTGVVFEDGDYRAFIEDTNASRVLRLSVGDPIARGKITEIDIDTIAYESSGKTMIINVGTTLTGIPYSAFTASPGATPAPGAAAAPASPLPDANNPNLTIEEKMKLRRAAELQPKK